MMYFFVSFLAVMDDVEMADGRTIPKTNCLKTTDVIEYWVPYLPQFKDLL